MEGSKSPQGVTIEASVRTVFGKSAMRKIRKTGKIPANLLEKGKSTPLTIDPKFLGKAWQNEKRFQMVLDGQERTVFIKELQLDPVKRFAVHVDLVYV